MSTNNTTTPADDDNDKNTSSPIVSPVTSPVDSPVTSPVSSPINSPVSSPINSPIARRKSSLTPPRPSKLSLRSLGDKKNARGTPTGGGGGGGSGNNFGSSRSSHHSRLSIGSTGSSHHSTSTGVSNNPITNDIKLNILVHEKLPKVQKYNQFQRWKTNFLTKFDSYLCESGTIPAKIASEKLQTTLEVCLQRSTVLLKHIDNGDLSVTTGKKTVKASLSLKEFCLSLIHISEPTRPC